MSHYCRRIPSWFVSKTCVWSNLAVPKQELNLPCTLPPSSLPYLPVVGNGWVLWEGGSRSSTCSVSSVDSYYWFNFTARSSQTNILFFLLSTSILLWRNKTEKKQRQQHETTYQLYLTSSTCGSHQLWGALWSLVLFSPCFNSTFPFIVTSLPKYCFKMQLLVM